GNRRDVACRTDLDRPETITHLSDGGYFYACQRHQQWNTIEVDLYVAKDSPAVRLSFQRRDVPIGVEIETRRDIPRDQYSRRHVDFDIDVVTRQGDASGLQIFVEPM